MIRAALALAALTLPASAATLDLPAGAVRAAERLVPLGSYAVPVAPWTEAEGLDAVTVEGRVAREAWHLPGTRTTLELLAPLREQLAAQGYETLFACETEACGGFDFRFETDVIPEPAMHVDLGDFRFLAARRGAGEAAEHLTLLVSRTSGTGYVQIVRVAPAEPGGGAPGGLVVSAPPEVPAAPPPAATPADLAAALEQDGRAILADLTFESGSSRLVGDDFPSLEALADYLRAHPGRRVTLVGHTDAAGSLEANIALSRSRARAAMERLIADHGIAAGQVEADGVGYLMPLAPNLTEAGRAANRRVEAVLTAVE